MYFKYLRWPGGLPKALTLSYDDGVEQDARLVSLMEAHHVKGTFNINSGRFAPEGTVYAPGRIHRPMTAAQCRKVYASDCVEVACHSVDHPSLAQMPGSVVMTQTVDDRRNLEAFTGQLVRGMAYPNGSVSDQVVRILGDAGIAYCRTTVSTHGFDLPTDLLRLPATCHHTDPQTLELARQFVDMKPERDAQLFYLWGHSYEFERDDNWDVIEQFLDIVSGKPDTWYATNIQIADYLEAYARLRYSADGKTVDNPSCTDVWLSVDGVVVKVSAGKSIRC